jgi:hypothetical protein
MLFSATVSFDERFFCCVCFCGFLCFVFGTVMFVFRIEDEQFIIIILIVFKNNYWYFFCKFAGIFSFVKIFLKIIFDFIIEDEHLFVKEHSKYFQ